MSVLVLSEDFDPTVDAVIDELHRRDAEVFRCDTAWFPTRMSVAAELGDGRWTGPLVTEDRCVSLVGLRSCWYRRPTAFVFPDGMSGPERRHAEWEAKLGFGGVRADLPLLWVNHPSREADAGYKPVQLTTAVRCGLTVPPTIITNRPDAVRRFAADQQGHVVVKPLAYSSVFEAGVGKAIYTHALSTEDLADLSGIEATVHLFQRAILDKVFEARVTVVGRRIFAAAIYAGSDAARADWRSDYDSLRISVVDLPPQVTRGVVAFMDAFGLMFGAFDFAVDSDGIWWFFECNSAGQFGFVEDATSLCRGVS